MARRRYNNRGRSSGSIPPPSVLGPAEGQQLTYRHRTGLPTDLLSEFQAAYDADLRLHGHWGSRWFSFQVSGWRIRRPLMRPTPTLNS